MRATQDIYFGVAGQLVFFDAPEGRPTAVTSVQVFTASAGDTSTPETAVGIGSVETAPDTTLDGAAGAGQPDPRNIPVAATTGVAVGRLYLVTSVTSGWREWVDVDSFVAGDRVGAKHPLLNAYAAADRFQSTRIQATIDPAWVADQGKLRELGPNPMYRVRWVYVVGGATVVAESYFNLLRYVGGHGVRPQDVEAIVPGWIDALPVDHRRDQGRRLIDQAHRDVKVDLHEVWRDDVMIAHAEALDDLVRHKAIEAGEWAKAVLRADNNYDLARGRYQAKLDALVRITSKLPTRDASGAAGARAALPLWRK